MIYGYARGIDGRPERHTSGRGIEETRGGQGFREVARGAKTDRAQLRFDRLARSPLLNTLAVIPGKKRAVWVVVQLELSHYPAS